MPARPGDWSLLDQDKDPVIADIPAITDLATYYTNMSDAITQDADVLGRIGDGSEIEAKGQAADKIRGKAKDVAGSLKQLSGRYEAVKEALNGFIPHLQTGLDDTATALQMAVEASGAQGSANAMPDPAANPPEGKEASDDDKATSAKRTAAIDQANDDMNAAKAKFQSAMDALNSAGKAASDTIRGAWDDGLHDSGWYKFIHMLVKILTIIGIILAVFAILVPGLGIASILSAITAGLSLMANAYLASIGEASFVDVLMSVVGVISLGVGVAVSKIASVAKISVMAKTSTTVGKDVGSTMSKTINNLEKIKNARGALMNKQLTGKISTDTAIRRLGELRNNERAITTKLQQTNINKIMDGVSKPANWWNIAGDDLKTLQGLRTTIGKDWDRVSSWSKLSENYGARLIGVDKYTELNKFSSELGAIGVAVNVPSKSWQYLAGGRTIYGGLNGIFNGIMSPTKIGDDQSRPWSDPWQDAKGNWEKSPA
jgi:hypothetical protein